MTGILVPIFICVVLPVAIVLIVFLYNMNSDNKRAEVLIKAIEANKDIDTDKLAEAFSKPRRSPREILNLRLLRGSIFTLCGLGFVIFGLVGLANDFTIRMEPVMIPMICGASCLAVGISYLIVYFVTRKQLADEDKE
jgi:hypothetical protein